MDTSQFDQLTFNADNLYTEETVTDLQTGTIRVLKPIKKDGSSDEAREPMFIAQTEIMTNAGALPVQSKMEAKTLEEAIEKFPAAVKQAVDEMIQRVQAMQREQANKIVTPGDMGGGGGVIPGNFGGGQGGGSGSGLIV